MSISVPLDELFMFEVVSASLLLLLLLALLLSSEDEACVDDERVVAVVSPSLGCCGVAMAMLITEQREVQRRSVNREHLNVSDTVVAVAALR